MARGRETLYELTTQHFRARHVIRDLCEHRLPMTQQELQLLDFPAIRPAAHRDQVSPSGSQQIGRLPEMPLRRQAPC